VHKAKVITCIEYHTKTWRWTVFPRVNKRITICMTPLKSMPLYRAVSITTWRTMGNIYYRFSFEATSELELRSYTIEQYLPVPIDHPFYERRLREGILVTGLIPAGFLGALNIDIQAIMFITEHNILRNSGDFAFCVGLIYVETSSLAILMSFYSCRLAHYVICVAGLNNGRTFK